MAGDNHSEQSDASSLGAARRASMSSDRKAQDRSKAEPDEADFVHPHHIEKMHAAAKVYDLASRRNAAPKRIVRGPDGKASHIVTDFQE